MSKRNVRQLVKRLREVANGENLPHSGLCALMEEYDLWYPETLFPMWDCFSGVEVYPVPHPEFDASYAYDFTRTEDFYDHTTVYGRRRLDLADFIADWLEEWFL